jgi:hypothetical protein
MKTFKYTFNEDTVDHFKFMSSYASKEEVYSEIEEFVENNCTLEENEVEKDLVEDLLNQVYIER